MKRKRISFKLLQSILVCFFTVNQIYPHLLPKKKKSNISTFKREAYGCKGLIIHSTAKGLLVAMEEGEGRTGTIYLFMINIHFASSLLYVDRYYKGSDQ